MPETIAEIQQFICEDRCQTIHNVTVQFGISYRPVYTREPAVCKWFTNSLHYACGKLIFHKPEANTEQHTQFPLYSSKKPTNFSLRHTVCELFEYDAAHVRSPIHTYVHLVCEPFGSHACTGLKEHVTKFRVRNRGWYRVAAKFVPPLLTTDQKSHWVDACTTEKVCLE